ncbi:MAG TPA: PAS domain S-box protein [Desulfobulbus sp.]|nr:PAS domain S-box protein [Desulfobulbus sp.]
MGLQQLPNQDLIDKIGVMVLGLDDQGRINLINAKGCEILGYTSEELIGLDWVRNFLLPADRQPVRDVFSQVMTGSVQHAAYHENFIQTRRNGNRMIAWHNTVLTDCDHRVCGMLSTGEDITARKLAEKDLRRSEERFRRLVDHAADALFIYDMEGRFIDVNKQACVSLGYPRRELLTLGVSDIDADFPEQRVEATIEHILDTEGPTVVHGRHRHKDGHVFPVEIKIDVLDRGGKPLFVAIARDISERKTNEERYRQLFERAPLAYQSLDETGCILEVNQAWLATFGYCREEVLGHHVTEFLCPNSRQLLLQQFPLSLETRSFSGIDFTIKNKDGSTTLVELTGRIFSGPGNAVRTHCILTDVGWRRKIELELEQSRALLEGIFLSAPIGIGLVVDRTFQWLNKRFSTITGYEDKELAGQNVRCLYADEEEFLRVGREKYEQMSTRKDHTGSVEALMRRKDSSLFPALLSSTPLDPADPDKGVVFTMMDISRQKADQQQLQQATEEWEKTFDAIKDIITIQDPDMRIIRANKAGREIRPGKNSSPVGRHCYTLLFGRRKPCEGCPVEATARDGQPHSKLMCYQGIDSRFEVSCAPITDKQGRLQRLVHVARDVSDLVQAENERARLMTAIDQASECVCITNDQGYIQYVNPAFMQKLGKKTEQLHGEQLCRVADWEENESIRAMREAVRQGRGWSGHLRRLATDETILEEKVSVSPVRDKEGRLINFVAISRDISREAALEGRLHQAMKMEAIGTLAGGIAHDFNNILSAVLGYAEMVNLQLRPDDPLRQDVGQIIAAGNRAAELVNQILTFSRKEEEDLRPAKLQFVVKEALKLLRSSFPTTIELRQDIDSTCSSVLADPTRIHQVLMNLCTNAKQAMGEHGGILQVSLKELARESVESFNHPPSIEQGRWLDLMVSDTGSGMESHIKEKIFDPFFTTKEKGEGTGLGLSVVHGIVKSHGGEISVQSQPGKGSTFHVYLPVIDRELKEDIKVVHSSLPRGHERILLVDDEPLLVDIIGRTLTSLGYFVSSFTDSRVALEQFLDHADEIDLIVTDMTMPQLTGIELAQRVLAVSPGMPIILCTGYSEYISADQAREVGVREFVAKPVDNKTLAEVVRKVLDA